MILENNRKTDLHLDIRSPKSGCLFRHTPMTTEDQKTLQIDVKAFVAEHIQQLKMPEMKPEAWAEATVEIVSESTAQYISLREDLLQEVANDTDDEVLAARINKVLR